MLRFGEACSGGCLLDIGIRMWIIDGVYEEMDLIG